MALRFTETSELEDDTRAALEQAHARAYAAADGDSNDEEIEALWEFIETLMSALQIKGDR